MATPTASRPSVPGYGVPTTLKGVLEWSHAVERLVSARNYWVCTTDADDRPHAVPVWGVWVDDTLCCGGGEVRWTRNLAANPNIAVHLESGDDVVIIEGQAELITDAAHPLVTAMREANQAKYGMDGGTPFWSVRPRVAYAWSKFPDNVTRWQFDGV